MKKIDINVDDIPISLLLKIKEKIYKLYFHYNYFGDRIYVDLFTENGDIIFKDEKIVYGTPLWLPFLKDSSGNLNPDFPNGYIRAISIDGIEREVNLENFGKSVILTLSDVE